MSGEFRRNVKCLPIQLYCLCVCFCIYKLQSYQHDHAPVENSSVVSVTTGWAQQRFFCVMTTKKRGSGVREDTTGSSGLWQELRNRRNDGLMCIDKPIAPVRKHLCFPVVDPSAWNLDENSEPTLNITCIIGTAFHVRECFVLLLF